MSGSHSNRNNNGSSGRQGSSSNDQYQYQSNREGSPEWSTFSASSGGRPANTGYALGYYARDHEANPTFYGHGQSRSEATQQYLQTWDHHWRQLGNATQSQGQGQTDNTNMYGNGGDMNGYGAGHGAGYGVGYETGYGQNSGLGYNGAATGGISTSQDQVDGYANERRFADGEDNEYEDGDVGGSAQHAYREKDRKKSKGKDKSKGSGNGKHRKY